ncbi:MAG: YHS domain-containing (seleno)protein, partial [Pseudomonadota bacterium]
MNMFKQLTLGLILSFFAGSALALDEINTSWLSNVALEGHDPVGYFKENAPVKGSKAHQLEWKGATWHFSSAENKALFESNPEKYAPQYGGYCAFAAAKNSIANGDPEQFTIVDDKLYLNYNAQVRKMWLVSTDKFIADA